MRGRTVVRSVVAVVGRPSLWVTAARLVVVLAVPGWWRRWPWLPWPDRAYLRFRIQTMYGDTGHEPQPEDLITYLRWCRAWPEVIGPTHR